MWVSGSLISSSTWRSSSVSAPSITSSIFLSMSRARSRTSRGSLFQALPIGCMRVFITPSCRSEVMCDSRCSGAVKPLFSCVRASCRSWLRVSTSSLTRVIRSSSTSTVDADGLRRPPAASVGAPAGVRRPARAAGAGAAGGGGRASAAAAASTGRRFARRLPARPAASAAAPAWARRCAAGGAAGAAAAGGAALPAAAAFQRGDQRARRRPPARPRWRPGRRGSP